MRKLRSATIYPIDYEDKKAWLAFRTQGIGGSEVAAIMNHSQYTSPAEIFHRKIGLLTFGDIDNEYMFLGRFMEEHIATLWKYWWQGEYMDNYKNQTPVRKCKVVKGYGVNPDYPWLFGSLDRYIPAGQMTLDGEELKDGGVLEVKTIGTFASNDWKYGIPEAYVLQIHAYMVIYGLEYAEIVFLQGGNKLDVLPVHYSSIIGDAIIEETREFWYNRVLPAQALVKEYHLLVSQGRQKEVNQYLIEIDRLEPSPDGTMSYREIMNMKKRDSFTREYTPADEAIYQKAVRHKAVKEMIKVLKGIERGMSNELICVQNHHQSEYVRFGEEGGYMRFYNKANANAPTFENRIKVEADKDMLKGVFESLVDKADGFMSKKEQK